MLHGDIIITMRNSLRMSLLKCGKNVAPLQSQYTRLYSLGILKTVPNNSNVK